MDSTLLPEAIGNCRLHFERSKFPPGATPVFRANMLEGSSNDRAMVARFRRRDPVFANAVDRPVEGVSMDLIMFGVGILG